MMSGNDLDTGEIPDQSLAARKREFIKMASKLWNQAAELGLLGHACMPSEGFEVFIATGTLSGPRIVLGIEKMADSESDPDRTIYTQVELEPVEDFEEATLAATVLASGISPDLQARIIEAFEDEVQEDAAATAATSEEVQTPCRGPRLQTVVHSNEDELHHGGDHPGDVMVAKAAKRPKACPKPIFVDSADEDSVSVPGDYGDEDTRLRRLRRRRSPAPTLPPSATDCRRE